MAAPIPTVILTEIFEISRGNKFDLNKMDIASAGDDDAIAFVGRSGENNGIVALVEEVDTEPYPAGVITVALGGAALSSFVQPRRFYTAQNIDVLTPRIAMSLDKLLYYCICIEANRFRYSTFGREANRTLRELMIPSFKSIPAWVEGSSLAAVTELNQDLLRSVK